MHTYATGIHTNTRAYIASTHVQMHTQTHMGTYKTTHMCVYAHTPTYAHSSEHSEDLKLHVDFTLKASVFTMCPTFPGVRNPMKKQGRKSWRSRTDSLENWKREDSVSKLHPK